MQNLEVWGYCVLIVLLFVIPIICILHLISKVCVNHDNKKAIEKRNKLQQYLPIRNMEELVYALEAEHYNIKQCYFLTYFLTTKFKIGCKCLLQKDNWIVCYADDHDYSNIHSFNSEQEACEYFFKYYFDILA